MRKILFLKWRISVSILTAFLLSVFFTSFGFTEGRWISLEDDKAIVDVSQAAVIAKKTNFVQKDYESEIFIEIQTPGVQVTQTDDNGLFEEQYDFLMLQYADKVITSNIDGNHEPDRLGDPDLPYIKIDIRVPYSIMEGNYEINLIKKNEVELSGLKVAPIQKRLPISFRPGIDTDTRTFQIKEEIYNQDAYFIPPVENELNTLYEAKLIRLSFSPFEYNPITKKLKIYKNIDIAVKYNQGTKNIVLTTRSTKLIDPVIKKHVFDARGTIDSMHDKTQGASQREGKFVIVTSTGLWLSQPYRDYIQYRTNQGYEHVTTIFSQGKLPSEIRNELKQVYEDQGFDYLIIMGDETQVPVYSFSGGSSDRGYASLGDSGISVFMGRFLTKDDRGLRNILNHQIWHEERGDWQDDIMILWGIDSVRTIGGDLSTIHYFTRNLDKPDGRLRYNMHRFFMTDFRAGHIIPEKYRPFQTEGQDFEDWVLTRDPFFTNTFQFNRAMVSAWNGTGAALIGLSAHGSQYGIPDMNFTFETFADDGNPEHRVRSKSSPLLLSMSCSTGAFVGDHSGSFSYQSQNNQYGTCATIAFTSWLNSEAAYFCTRSLTDAIFRGQYHMPPSLPAPDGDEPLRNVGQIFAVGNYVLGGNTSTYHLFGDPMTNLMLNLPTPPVVDSFSAAPRVGKSPLDVTFTVTAMSGAGHIHGYCIDYGDGTPEYCRHPITGNPIFGKLTFTLSHTYSSKGVYNPKIKVYDQKYSFSDYESGPTINANCFIATAAYGSALAEEVNTLRAFRDQHLMKNAAGREFVELYYELSPPLANFIADKPVLRAAVRFLLRPLVWVSERVIK